jgi:hypothetical protein
MDVIVYDKLVISIVLPDNAIRLDLSGRVPLVQHILEEVRRLQQELTAKGVDPGAIGTDRGWLKGFYSHLLRADYYFGGQLIFSKCLELELKLTPAGTIQHRGPYTLLHIEYSIAGMVSIKFYNSLTAMVLEEMDLVNAATGQAVRLVSGKCLTDAPLIVQGRAVTPLEGDYNM